MNNTYSNGDGLFEMAFDAAGSIIQAAQNNAGELVIFIIALVFLSIIVGGFLLAVGAATPRR